VVAASVGAALPVAVADGPGWSAPVWSAPAVGAPSAVAVPSLAASDGAAVSVAVVPGAALSVAVGVGFCGGVVASGNRSGSTAWSRDTGASTPSAPAWCRPTTSASAQARGNFSFRRLSRRPSQETAEEGASAPRTRIEAMIRGSTARATLCPSAASSWFVSVPSTAVAAARAEAVRIPWSDAGMVTGIATATSTGARSVVGFQVKAERPTAKVRPAV
jgi:hypothetical protein